MTEKMLMEYMARLTTFTTRSMFGGIGLFKEGAMFAAVTNQKLYIRGGGKLDKCFADMGCGKLLHVKKHTTVRVNYYDVTQFLDDLSEELRKVITLAIEQSVSAKAGGNTFIPHRLRDLPNMRLTLERMVRKAGINDIETFCRLGASEVFSKVRAMYGNQVDENLLWKFAGAIEGKHWKLIQEHKKRELLKQCREVRQDKSEPVK